MTCLKKMFSVVMLITLYTSLSYSKIVTLNHDEITDLNEVSVGKCRQGWGEKMNVIIQTNQEKYVYIYCSEQPLSAYMTEVYTNLRNFVAGPNTGHCEVKTWCDQWNRCRYEAGQWRNETHKLKLITNSKNEIHEDYANIIFQTNSTCVPLSCAIGH